MGEVWSAVHEATGQTVAIKTIRPEFARDDDFRDQFRREVEAMAGLHHPNITMVLDHGVDENGQPFLVMEHASGGTLEQRPPPIGFQGFRETVLAMLAALAHAHARDLLHLDLKPANILVFTDQDTRPGLKLTDFGLSRLGWVPGGEPAGTPNYMSPEQIVGDWRDMGPWTDLYGLGALAWLLATRRPVFDMEDPLPGHLRHEPPTFQCSFGAPPQLEDWLRQLLAKDPGDRFATAAEAAWALTRMPEVPGDSEDTAWIGHRSTTFAFLPPPQDSQPRARPLLTSLPVPKTWSRTEQPVEQTLYGAGLGLMGIRPFPFVGRHDERTHIWSALREVRASGHARVIRINGAPGLGSSRLMTWMAHRAHELGAAQTLVCEGSVEDALRRRYRTHGESVADLTERLSELGSDARHLAELLVNGDFHGRVPLLHRAVLRLARGAPLMLVLDDPDAVATELADRLEATAQEYPAPVLVLVRSDGGLQLKPLSPGEMNQLLSTPLHLDQGLRAHIEDCAQGNPQYAIQLLQGWAESGILRANASGFHVHQRPSTLPPGLEQVWEGRLRSLFKVLDDGERIGLILGALLGPRVRESEWRLASPSASRRGWDHLAAAGHIKRTPDGWLFLSEGLVQALARRARPEHHRTCIQTLKKLDAVVQERIGQHLLVMEDWEAAADALLKGARVRAYAEEYETAGHLCDRAEFALERSTLPPDHPLYGRLLLRRQLIMVNCWRFDEVIKTTPQAIADATQRWPEHLSWLHNAMARSLYFRGDLDRALDHGALAMTCASRPLQKVQAAFTLMIILTDQGHLRQAEAFLEAAKALLPDDNPHPHAEYLNGRSQIARKAGDLEEAFRLQEAAFAICEEHGFNDAMIALSHLAVFRLEQRRAPEARALLEACERRAAKELMMSATARVACLRIELAALERNWPQWDRAIQRAPGLLKRTGVFTRDLAESLDRAASLAEAAGEAGRASRARAFSQTMLEQAD